MDCPKIISSQEWNAEKSKSQLTNLTNPVSYAVFMHTAGADCSSKESCKDFTKTTQFYQMYQSPDRFADTTYKYEFTTGSFFPSLRAIRKHVLLLAPPSYNKLSAIISGVICLVLLITTVRNGRCY